MTYRNPSNTGTISGQFLLCQTIALLLGYGENTHYVEHQISIFGKHYLNNTMSNFIVLTCSWFQSVTGSVHVNSRDANTLHAQKRNKRLMQTEMQVWFHILHSFRWANLNKT